ncbi:MAG: CoA transferase [Sphingomonadales bacterium]|nr:CoA transferase [Sphingomonadales bacterium]
MLTQLSDLRVIEMGTFITGPAASMQLADLGADVVKVERPETGDPFRAFEGDLYSPHFQTYNRNKRSVTLDTRDPVDLARFDDLIANADVFIQNFRPGAAEKLNAGYERLSSLNPRLIYCSISGFGSSGPDEMRPAFDTVAQASSGFLRLLLNPKEPRVVGPAIADAITGIYAAMGILSALHARNSNGRGAKVELSMLEAMSYFNLDDFTHHLSEGIEMGPFSRPEVSQSYVFHCADGHMIALHMSSPPKFWENLLTALDHPELIDNPIFASRAARISHYETILDCLRPLFAAQPLAHWKARFAQFEVPHAEVATPQAVLASPQAQHLALEVSGESPRGGTFRTIRNPLRINGERMDRVIAPPLLGQHNAAIFGE